VLFVPQVIRTDRFPCPPLVTRPEMLYVAPDVPEKLTPVTLAPLTVTLRLAGVKVYPVLLGVTV